MMMPDVNVLIYAHRRESASHYAYRRWFEQLVGSPSPFALSTLVAGAFVRLATNKRVFTQPTPIEAALATIDAIVAAPNCVLCSPSKRHWSLLRQLCAATSATGKLVADAQHAAVAPWSTDVHSSHATVTSKSSNCTG